MVNRRTIAIEETAIGMIEETAIETATGDPEDLQAMIGTDEETVVHQNDPNENHGIRDLGLKVAIVTENILSDMIVGEIDQHKEINLVLRLFI